MARITGFPSLFLLSLSLGCFLCASNAEPLPYEQSRSAYENDNFLGRIPHTQYREIPEEDVYKNGLPPRDVFRKMTDEDTFDNGSPQRSIFRKRPEEESFDNGAQRSVFRKIPEQTFESTTSVPKSEYTFREAAEQSVKSSSSVPKSQYAFREAPERVFESGTFRRQHEEIGFRKSLVSEIRDVLDAFDRAYLDNGKCEKLKEKVAKMTGFLRMALDFVN